MIPAVLPQLTKATLALSLLNVHPASDRDQCQASESTHPSRRPTSYLVAHWSLPCRKGEDIHLFFLSFPSFFPPCSFSFLNNFRLTKRVVKVIQRPQKHYVKLWQTRKTTYCIFPLYETSRKQISGGLGLGSYGGDENVLKSDYHDACTTG